jgi:hypothetical protein
MGRDKRTNSKPPSLSSPTDKKQNFPFRSGKKNVKINRFPKRVDREIPFIKPTRKSINLDDSFSLSLL